ncbi:MAG: glycoside hydrolase family 3 protein, partial [Jiangellaceae bacterium]
MDRSLDPAHLRGLALGTLFPGFEGTTGPPPWLAGLITEGVGGVVLFGRNVDPARGDAGVARLTARLHAVRPDLLIAIDEEGGDVTRLDATTGSELPGSAALGSVDDVALTRDVAASLGARLRACGIDINFAPVADVDVDPLNPVVGVRAFGSDPALVARHVAAFVAGQQSAGVAATAKHFPGHGATDEDSHVTVPTVTAAAELLERRELAPFRAAVTADAKIVMTAHIKVSAVDVDNPATLSPAVITGLLRGRLGYAGVVMTDGLDMHAISRTVGHAEAAVRALLSGVDAVCVGGESTDRAVVERIVAALAGAVESGRLPYQRLAEAAGRVRSLA